VKTSYLVALNAVCESHRLRPSYRMVVRVIADHAYGDRDVAWPSNATIAQLVGLSVGHVRRILAQLRQLGVIVRRSADNLTGREFFLPFKQAIAAAAAVFGACAGGARRGVKGCAPRTGSPGAQARTELEMGAKQKLNAGDGGLAAQEAAAAPVEETEAERQAALANLRRRIPRHEAQAAAPMAEITPLATLSAAVPERPLEGPRTRWEAIGGVLTRVDPKPEPAPCQAVERSDAPISLGAILKKLVRRPKE
jgi:hypothetical protein